MLFSESRRLVRVAGRDFSLAADDGTLVLLAVESSDRGGEWAISSHTIQIAACVCRGVDHALGKEANLRRLSEDRQEQDRAWRTAIAADPIIQSFVQATDRTS